MSAQASGPRTEVVIAPDAVQRLVDSITGKTLVVADVNTHHAAAQRVAQALPGSRELVFGACSRLLAGLDEVQAVRNVIGDADELVAVGSGVITDIVRYAAHLSEREFISVPTAASMDGYASSVAAMQIDGVKVTYPARSPKAIFADPVVAAAAPKELTRAGLGDLLAKASAGVDWLAAHLLYGEPFDEQVERKVDEAVQLAARSVESILGGGVEAVEQLLRGLIESGIAMALVGSSRPASGCEHHASHFWDLLAARGRRQHASHGLQVGYATRFAMRLQRFAYGGGIGVPRPPGRIEDPLGPAARAWLGEPTPEIVAAVEEKERFAAAGPAQWPGDEERWAAVRGELEPRLARFQRVDDALEAAGFPLAPGYLGIDAETLHATFRYATRLRARYTTVDFLEGQGALEDALATIF